MVALKIPFGSGGKFRQRDTSRATKFYQELKQDDGKEYSRSTHVAIRGGINRYLNSEAVGKTFSIISDPIFKTANKSLNAKLKKIKECGTSKVKHHRASQLRTYKNVTTVVFLVMTRLYRC